MKLLLESEALISVAELTKILGADPESVNNWIRRGIIRRSPVGGRTTRHRLFSPGEVYKAALKYELIKMGLPPSSASDALNTIWELGFVDEIPESKILYALLFLDGEKWSSTLCWQNKSGGLLYRFKEKSPFKTTEPMTLPTPAFLATSVSQIFIDVTSKLTALLNERLP